jgi:outer membrane receptor protein involved in Fe transport
VWKPGDATTFHAGYARTFTPPPLELIVGEGLEEFDGTTGETPAQQGDPVRAQRDHIFDIGVQQILGPLTLGLDAYYKRQRNLIDLEQLGGSLIQSPYNFERATSWGIEFSASYKRGPLALYLNAARGDQRARRIVSNQFFFEPDELEYIAANEIFTDHSQSWTVSGGGSLTLRNPLGTLEASFDAIHGSGLRAGEVQDLLPNSITQEPYLQVNLGLAQTFGDDPGNGLTLRIDVTNLFDRVYLIHDGKGVGSNQPEWGPRRAIFFGLLKAF